VTIIQSIQRHEVQVLIDGGSLDIFIQPRVTEFLDLLIEPTPEFTVMIGNFRMMTVEGCISALEVNKQGHTVMVPQVYVLQ